MSPSANNANSQAEAYFIIGIPESRRVTLFQAALARLGRPPAQVLSYLDLLNDRIDLSLIVREGAILRIESPGKDFDVERALLARGASIEDDPNYDRLSSAAVAGLAFDRGRILYPRQWYLGYRSLLQKISEQLARCPEHRLMNRPDDIAVMFDKPLCHRRLGEFMVPVPQALGSYGSYEELREAMRRRSVYRVFLKPAHGSSGSGVVAYQTDGERYQATTTVEMVCKGGETLLYNSRRLRVYKDLREITTLIDALCRHRVHVERWAPKAGIDGRTFDLRVLVIGGRARHTVARLSAGPITNLHLLNRRGDIELVRRRLGTAGWETAMKTCERAAAAFPRSFYVGVDLLVLPCFKRFLTAEVNAFGDLLPDLFFIEQDVYTTEILAVSEKGAVECSMLTV